MKGDYIDLTIRDLAKWQEFTERQREGAIVRHASRDERMERLILQRERERIADQLRGHHG